MMTAYIFLTHEIATRFYQTARKRGYSVRILGNAVIGDNDAIDIFSTHIVPAECLPQYTATVVT